MSLKDQIEAQQAIVRKCDIALRVARKNLDELKQQQATCAHTFSDPIKGYEHEGGYCTECGVNELYAMTLKNQ